MSLPEQETTDVVYAAPYVSLHEVDGGGVLFDAQGKRLFAFNETATFIWRRIEDGIPPFLILDQMSREFTIPREQATEFVDAAIRSWGELSLLAVGARQAGDMRTAPSVALATQARPISQVPQGRHIPSARVSQTAAAPRVVSSTHYRLFDMPFMVQGNDARILRLAEGFLWPLASQPVQEPLAVLDIANTGDGIELSADGILLEYCEEESSLLPLLKTCLVELALRRTAGLGAVHAAAVAGPQGAVLLPARSGEGKSTLTAALLDAGYRLLGDDTVALSDAVEARPAAFPICLKEGAWTLLAARFPQLAGAATHRRMDGKMVRYLFPESRDHVAQPLGRYPIRWVVFLRRGADEVARLVPLRKADALSRLTAEFSPLEGGLSERQIERLVQWIRTVDCFELRFSDVDEGVEQITRLCGEPRVAEFTNRH